MGREEVEAMTKKPMWLGKRLRQLRKEKGLTVYALAKNSGVTKQAIGRLEGGIAFKPTWETIQLLCRALGVSCTEFVDPTLAPETSKQ
jgi:transcriptional regulator with XRE-family HTH domain